MPRLMWKLIFRLRRWVETVLEQLNVERGLQEILWTLYIFREQDTYIQPVIRHFHETKDWSIGWMCGQLEVSRVAYYKWMHQEIPLEEQENIKLVELIREYDEHFHHILGYRRMTS